MAKGHFQNVIGNISQVHVANSMTALPQVANVTLANAQTIHFNAQVFNYQPNQIIYPLPEKPGPGKTYELKGKHAGNYGLPKFRLQPIVGEPAPEIWFERDEEEQLWLQVIAEAYREEKEVKPFDFRTIQMKLRYSFENETHDLPLKVTATPYASPVSTLKYIHAKVALEEEQAVAVRQAMIEPDGNAQLHISAQVWWQKIKRSNPTTTGGNTVNPIANLSAHTIHHQVPSTINTPNYNPNTSNSSSTGSSTTPTLGPPQKVEVSELIYLKFTTAHHTVFRGIFSGLETEDYKWEKFTKIDGVSLNYPLHYRRTKDPSFYYFLPQAFKLGIKEDKKVPHIDVMVYNEAKEDDEINYRYSLTSRFLPYFDPREKKKFLIGLRDQTAGETQYVELGAGGVRSASFGVNEAFVSLFSALQGQIYIDDKDFNPLAGFEITFNASLESINELRRQINEQMLVGYITFELEEEAADGSISLVNSNKIPVVLDLQDLATVPLTSELVFPEQSDETSAEKAFPSALKLKTELGYNVQIDGLDLTLLSKVEGSVYQVDYFLRTEGIDWPLLLEQGENDTSLMINQEDINKLVDKDQAHHWNTLQCEPYGIKWQIDAIDILDDVIDYATTDLEFWLLEVMCPTWVFWENLDEEVQQEHQKIFEILVEVKDPFGNIQQTVLSKAEPTLQVNLSEGLKLSEWIEIEESKDFTYRIKLNKVDREGTWSEWLEGGGDRLRIYL